MEPTIAPRQGRRPLPVTVFAILHLVFGLLTLLAAFGMLNRLNGSTLKVIVAHIWTLCIACLCIGSAFGSWKGKTWGWWCTVLLYTGWSMKSILELLMASDIFAAAPLNDGIGFIKHSPVYYLLALAFYVAVLVYFYRSNTRHFFDLAALSKRRALFQSIAIMALFLGIGQLLFMLT